MSGMIEVAKATVTIIPNMQGAQQTITEELVGASEQAGAKASESAGTSFLGGFGDKLGGLGGMMAKALPVAAVAATGKALFDVGSQFDEMTDAIVIGTGASGEALESLQQSAKDMATAVPISFGEAGNIVQDLNTRLGLAGDTLTDVGTQVAQLGQITGEAFNTEKFAGAMSAWGTSAEDMSGQLDTLFAVSQSTGIGMNDLTGIMESAAPQMQTLGYSFEETAAMAGMLDKAGLDASGMMGKMSKALTTLAKDGEEPSEALKRVTDEIGGYIEAGDDAAALDAASKLFGTKGASQFVQAVKSGSMQVDEFVSSLENSEGIINDTQTGTMDFAEQVQLLKNNFLELIEPMGSAVFGALSEAMTVLTDNFRAFVDGPGQTISDIFGEIVDFGGQLAGIFADAFKDTSGASNFAGVMRSVGAAIRPVVTVLGSLLKAVLPPLVRLLGGALGAAFRTIGSIVTGVRNTFNRFKSTIQTVKDAFYSFKDAITAPFNFLSGLKIPHISISGGSPPFGIGGLGEAPHIGVTWGAKGGILDGATLIGAGEAGKEALLPLERNTGWMDTLADKIGGRGTVINVTVNGAENPETWARRFVNEYKLAARTV